MKRWRLQVCSQMRCLTGMYHVYAQGATATALLLASLNQEEVAARLGSTPAPAFGILVRVP